MNIRLPEIGADCLHYIYSSIFAVFGDLLTTPTPQLLDQGTQSYNNHLSLASSFTAYAMALFDLAPENLDNIFVYVVDFDTALALIHSNRNLRGLFLKFLEHRRKVQPRPPMIEFHHELPQLITFEVRRAIVKLVSRVHGTFEGKFDEAELRVQKGDWRK